jgi:hypothetical protein
MEVRVKAGMPVYNNRSCSGLDQVFTKGGERAEVLDTVLWSYGEVPSKEAFTKDVRLKKLINGNQWLYLSEHEYIRVSPLELLAEATE